MVNVTAASGSIGAYIDDVDLRCVDSNDRAQILAAWHQWGVVFFRGQHLTADEQVEAARIFGEPEPFEMAPRVDEQQPFVHQIATPELPRRQGGSSTWHSDASWKPEPPRGSILQAIQLPEIGGDTLFASAASAYQSLSSGLQRMMDELSATHEGGEALRRASARVARSVPQSVHHPVVRTHPDTLDRCLYVNRVFTQRIDNVSRRESEVLLPLLCDQFRDPELQCRFRWEVGDLAVWDNRSVQHYAAPDYQPPRLMHRIVLAGEPVSS